MISPIAVATRGFFNGTLGIATRGYLLPIEETVAKAQGGGFEAMIDQNRELVDTIMREDEEILVIIKAFLECL